MFVLAVVLSVLLAVFALGAGLAAINRVPQIVAVVRHVGAERLLPVLGWLQLAAAAGLLVGVFVAPIGVAAAAGLVAYFAGAAIAHLRVKDPLNQVVTPLVPFVVAAITLATRAAA